MSNVTGHVLLGSPERYHDGLTPEFLATLHEKNQPVWQVHDLRPQDQGSEPRSDVLVVPAALDQITLALVVGLHVIVGSEAVADLVPGDEDGRVSLENLSKSGTAAVEKAVREHPLHLAATVTWSTDSALGNQTAEALCELLTGHIAAATEVWSQIGSGHDGFGTPGDRSENPAWRKS